MPSRPLGGENTAALIRAHSTGVRWSGRGIRGRWCSLRILSLGQPEGPQRRRPAYRLSTHGPPKAPAKVPGSDSEGEGVGSRVTALFDAIPQLAAVPEGSCSAEEGQGAGDFRFKVVVSSAKTHCPTDYLYVSVRA